MQIHELTLKQQTQIDEGIASSIGSAVGKGVGAVKKVGTAVASPFRDVAAGYRTGKVDAKTASIADKAYRAWSAYRQQLDKAAPGGKADPATVEKQLMAFVSKNLLGGQYVPNLINKDQIIGLVKQIATGGAPAQQPAQKTAQQPAQQPAATKPHTGGKVAGQLSQTPGAIKKREQRVAAKSQNTAGAQAFGQMATQLQKPATAAPAQGVRAGTVPSTPAGAQPKVVSGPVTPKEREAYQKKLQAAAAKQPVQEATAPAQELELFKKLVTAASQAQSEVETGDTGRTAQGGKVSTKQANDPQALAGQVAQVEKQGGVDPAVLAKAGKILQTYFKKGSPVIKKTGDAAVDALLINMGFQL